MKKESKKATVGVGDVITVRLALLEGMTDKNPDPQELSQMRLARTDPTVMDDLLKQARKEQKNDALTTAALSEQLWLYPRYRQARVLYVDRMGGGVSVLPSGAPGEMKPSSIGSINLEVKTPGSTVMQPAVGHYPKWAQETFRLEGVAFYAEEPDDESAQSQHVAFPTPEQE